MEMLTELICGPKKARKLFIRRMGGRKIFANRPFYPPLSHADVISVARRSLSRCGCAVSNVSSISSKVRLKALGCFKPSPRACGLTART